MGKSVAVANQKGGVGKTTTVVNLGAALTRLGKRVVAIDADPQGHLTLSTGVRPDGDTVTLYELLMDRSLSPVDALAATRVEGLRIIPATSDLAGAEVQLAAVLERHALMTPIVAALREEAEFVLIDCPPSLSLLTINALAACDWLLAPLECSYLATQGFRELMDTFGRVRERLNPRLELCGIVLTMYDGRTLHSREVAEATRASFGGQVFESVIPHSVRFREAPMVGESMLDYAPDHPGAAAYMSLAREVIGREG
jgi:chromosome partitioning protein